MRRIFVYLKLELKKALKTIPYLLTGAIVLVALIGIIAFCAGKVLNQGAAFEKVEVGVVLPEGDSVTQMAISFLSTMESVESFCEFVAMEEEEALSKLRKREIFAVLAVPTEFVQHIIDGTNTPVVVILPEQANMEAALLKELTSAGELSLSSSQAGIYAAGEFFIKNGMSASLPEVEQTLNDIYMSHALSRTKFFETEQVTSFGELTIFEYYGAAAALLFLLLCGIPCAFYLKKEPKALQGKLRVAGVSGRQMMLSKITAVSMLLGITVICFGLIGMIICKAAGISMISFSLYSVLLILIMIMVLASMIVFIYEITRGPIEGILLLFISSIVMMFLSGGILPMQFLPKAVSDISPFIPTTELMKLIGAVIKSEYNHAVIIKVLLLFVIFYLGSVFACEREA